MSYLMVTVALHGLEGTVEDHVKKIDQVLRHTYNPLYRSDIEVEVVEHSTGLICDQ